MKDKVSIVVPVYKVEQHINRCIDSILCQTYTNIEIILVDDGSPDCCGEICENYKKKDTRIKVIHTDNGGLSAARNVGIKNATGKYIMFIDSDDYIKNDMVEYLYDLLTKNNCDISICNYIYTFENDTKDYIGINGIYEDIFNSKDALNELLKDDKIKSFAWNKLYKRKLFKSIKFPEKKLMEDIGTTYKLFMKSDKIVSGSEAKYFYVQRNGSILHNKKPNFYIDYYEMAYERFTNVKKIDSKMETNYLFMLYTSFDFILVKNKEVQKYISENNVINNTKKIIDDIKKLKINVSLNTKIKFLLFGINIKIFKAFFRGWNKWILKKVDSM